MSRTRFRPLCLHLQRNLFVRRMQELLLPATVYTQGVAYAQAIKVIWNSLGPARGLHIT